MRNGDVPELRHGYCRMGPGGSERSANALWSRRGSCDRWWRTSSGETPVSYGEDAPVPVVGQPDLGECGRSGGGIRSDDELDATECGQVRLVNTGVDVRDVDAGVRGKVRGHGERDASEGVWAEGGACLLGAGDGP